MKIFWNIGLLLAIMFLFQNVTAGLSSTSDHVSAGDLYFTKGLYSDAVLSYNLAIENNPTVPVIWFKKGLALSEAGRYSEAIYCFDMTLVLDPDFDIAWRAKGMALSKIGNFDDAKMAHYYYLVENSHNPYAWYNIGNTFYGSGDFANASLCFWAATTLKPD